MKKIISVLLCAAMLVSVLTLGAFAEDAQPQRTGTYTYAAPVIDGETDALWDNAQRINMKNEAGYIKVLWNESGLYILVWAKSAANDKTTFIISEKYASWMQWWQTGNDCEGNYAITVKADGLEKRWYDKSSASAQDLSQSGIQYAMKAAEKGMYIEAFFPLRMEGAYIENAEIKLAVHLSSEGDQSGILVGGWDSTNGYCYKLSSLESLILVANSCTHENWLDADCTAPHRCASCGKPDGEALDPQNHAKEAVWIITEETHSKVYPCCDTKVTDSAAHTWGEAPSVDVEPTCTEKGSQSVHCTVCDAKKSGTESELEALGHRYSEDYTIDVEPTCTKKGSQSRHCIGCEETTDTKDVEPLGHDYGDWTVVAKASCAKEGKEHTTCKRCWAEGEVRAIPKLEHTGGDWIVDKEAGVGVAGKRHKLCSVCNQSFDEEEIPALPAESETTGEDQNASGGCQSAVSGTACTVVLLLLLLGTAFVRRSVASRKQN